MAVFREKWRLAALGLKASAWECSTQRTYASYRKSYLEFCELAGYTPVPVSPHMACEYVAYLADRLAYSSILKYVGIFRILHEEMGLPDPKFLKQYDVKLILLALKKHLGTVIKRQYPVDPELLCCMYSKLDSECTNDMVFWAITLIGFFGLLRISNLLPPSVDGFDPQKHLIRLRIRPRVGCIVVVLVWSKNNQSKARVVEIPIPRVHGSVLCPVSATLKAFRLTSEVSLCGPAFMRRDSDGSLKPILYGWFSKKLLDLVEQCGLARADFGTHSLRRGGASWALKCGFSTDVIKILGDWHSDAYQCYLEIPFKDKLCHMQKFASCVATSM